MTGTALRQAGRFSVCCGWLPRDLSKPPGLVVLDSRCNLALRGLERDGIVTRTIFPTSPPQVEYSLTALGRSMAEPVMVFGEWVRAHLAELDAARRRFDDRDDRSRPAAESPAD